VTLKQELDARRAKSAQNAPPERSAAFQRGVDQLIADGIADRAVKEGDIAPDFSLPNARGDQISLYACLARGPVVLAFYRGGWCPYCNMQLRAYQAILPEFRSLGATLIAISPETPDASLSTTEKNELEFEVLSDINSDAGRAFRLMFELPDELQAIYTEMGNDLARRNADGKWHLPIPATYVIDANKRVTLAFLDADYRNRLEPADIIAALRTQTTTVA
jgi:peroxiredoxin